MSPHALSPRAAVEVPGLAYFTPPAEAAKPAARVAPPPRPLDALTLMYAYYSAAE